MRGAVRGPQEAVDDRGRFEPGADEEEDGDDVADLVVELRVGSTCGVNFCVSSDRPAADTDPPGALRSTRLYILVAKQTADSRRRHLAG